MKKKLSINMLVLLAGSLFLVSCFDNEVDHFGYGDAYVIVEKSGDNVVKGLGLHAFSYSDFSSVIVALPAGSSDSIHLKSYLGYRQDYFWETPAEAFSTAMPQAGDYVFNAVFADGYKLVFLNTLTTGSILPPKIKLIKYVVSGEKVNAEWESVANADLYNVKLIGEEGKTLYVSPELRANATSLLFGKTDTGWQSQTYPENGQLLKVVVSAYLLEKGNSGGRLQAISRSESEIVWGN